MTIPLPVCGFFGNTANTVAVNIIKLRNPTKAWGRELMTGGVEHGFTKKQSQLTINQGHLYWYSGHEVWGPNRLASLPPQLHTWDYHN